MTDQDLAALRERLIDLLDTEVVDSTYDRTVIIDRDTATTLADGVLAVVAPLLAERDAALDRVRALCERGERAGAIVSMSGHVRCRGLRNALDGVNRPQFACVTESCGWISNSIRAAERHEHGNDGHEVAEDGSLAPDGQVYRAPTEPTGEGA